MCSEAIPASGLSNRLLYFFAFFRKCAGRLRKEGFSGVGEVELECCAWSDFPNFSRIFRHRGGGGEG